MKTTITRLVLFVALFIGHQVTAQQVGQTGAAITVNKEVHDYGNIKHKANGDCEFIVTNTGTEPLILATVKGSCQCTVPSWPTEPIAPGASATIKVTYNTERVGAINKTVTITSNAVNEPTKVVRIKGNVMAAPDGTSPVNESGAPAVGN